MTYFADLTPYEYYTRDPVPYVALNVGWLEKGEPFEVGDVPDEFIERLAVLCVWRQVRLMRGSHHCDRCPNPGWQREGAEAGGLSVRLGNGEISVAGPDGKLYAAPTLVYHYVVAHGYRPPDEFVEAVLRSEDAQLTAADGPPVPESSWLDHPCRVAARLTLWSREAGGLRWAPQSGFSCGVVVAGADIQRLPMGGWSVRIVTAGQLPLLAGTGQDVVLHFADEMAAAAVEEAAHFDLVYGRKANGEFLVLGTGSARRCGKGG